MLNLVHGQMYVQVGIRLLTFHASTGLLSRVITALCALRHRRYHPLRDYVVLGRKTCQTNFVLLLRTPYV